MPLHKRVFYRGLKHELFAKQAAAGESNDEEVNDQQLLAKKLADLDSIWQCPRNAGKQMGLVETYVYKSITNH